ncbi:OmpA family protein [Methylocystis sp. MJC1]|jgi:outer membrane protein OmpA-like peptidoglycan-associated protein|uniref:OmpA family protein n=1 Tax=Methylocystis sp. MJC1 TaxID=2654282 RepID=UPI0013EC0F92|nr:OmpA family protein [Methylocystis sp. MJC1]KAF2989575.1 hypothetical protein MJC1_03342 [Methylocystis sp. MJC1]MBU6528511.1 OmpA family protein [Methylocystis sp. MJC1]UZX11408.1 OmpA family protein [Methylocystis sp. MJC1]
MLDFYVHLWPWLAACLAVGAATGALTPGQTRGKGPARWLIWVGLASLAGAAAIALGAVEGAVSSQIELGLACIVSLMLGAGATALIFQRTLTGHEAWALGLIPAMLLWSGASQIAAPAYEADLQKRIAALAQAAGADPASLALSGRDITAPPAVAANKELIAQIAATPGVGRVISASAPAPVENDKKPEQTAAIQPAPLPPPSAPTPEAQSSGEFDLAACQHALDAVVASDPVAFREARATVNRRTALALDKAAEVIRQCPDTTIEVRGHGDAGVEDDVLSRRRALAAAHYLRLEGVSGHKLVAVGCCEKAKDERRPGAIDYIAR